MQLNPSTEDQLLLPESDQQQQQQELLIETAPVPVDEIEPPTETPESALSPLSVDTAEADNIVIPEAEPAREPEVQSASHLEEVDEDMSSQLNPDAVEFVPLSPQNSAPVSPVAAKHMDQDPFIMGQTPQIAAIIEGDRILAQSPRKNSGNGNQMDNVVIPDEREFDAEIESRPHEWSGDLLGKKIDLNGSVNGVEGLESPGDSQPVVVDDDEDAGTLNSKEERDLDEEKEELRDEMIKEIIDNITAGQNGHAVEEEEQTQNGLLAGPVPGEQDPMNMSFHQDVQVTATGGNPFDLNAVQLLPTGDDIEEEEDEQSKGDANVEERFEQMKLEPVEAVAEVAAAVETVQDNKPMELTESENSFVMQQPEADEPERKEFDEKDEEALEEQKPIEDSVPEIVHCEMEIPVAPTEAPAEVAEVPVVSEPEKPVEDVPLVAVAAAAATTAVAAAAAVAAVSASKAKPSTPTAKKTPTPAKRDVTTAKPKTPTTLGVKASPVASRATPSRISSTTKTATTGAAAKPTVRASPLAARSPLVEKKTANTATKAATPTRPSSSAPKPTARTPTTPTATRTARTSLAPAAASPKTTTTAASRVAAARTATSTLGTAGVKRATPPTTGTTRTVSKTTTTTTATAAARPKPTTAPRVSATKTTTTTSTLGSSGIKKTTTATTGTASRYVEELRLRLNWV